MPRYLPLLADSFDQDCTKLLNFSRRLEQNYSDVKIPNAGITLSGLELSYELIYLKIFLLWEDLLENIFLRLLCGFASTGGVETPASGVTFCKSINGAKLLVLGARDYILWHNPEVVWKRSDKFFDPGHSFFRGVILASEADLKNYAAVRHRIAHAQDHAKRAFDDSTMIMAGKRYPASSAGRFLRDNEPAGPNRRWLQVITDELSSIAHQLC